MLVLTFLAQSSIELAFGDALPAGHRFLSAHGAAYFTCATFSCVHEHVTAKRAIPEFRSHHKQAAISFQEAIIQHYLYGKG